MKKCRILLVEDDEHFRKTLRKILEARDCEVHACVDGRQARETIKTSTFDIVISDIEMPHLTGIELMEWSRTHHPVPIILITGFTNLLNLKTAYDLGAVGFLTKPFSEESLFEELRKTNLVPSLSRAPEKPEKSRTPPPSAEDYCKILIDDFVSGSRLDFSIYVKMSDSKFIKIAHTGQDVSLKQVQSYREKGLKYLYVLKSDYHNLVGFNLKLSKAIASSKGIDPSTKLKFFKYTGEIIAQRLFVSDLDDAAFEDSKEFVLSSLDVISDDPSAMLMLEMLNSHADFLYAHAVGVAIYGVMIAKKLEWISPQTTFKISLAGLYHDIGKKEISRDILTKHRSLMNADERKIYESHTVRGKEILDMLSSFPGGISDVAAQHHENPTGLGFPRGMKRSAIFPLAALISVANRFCELVVASPHSPGMNARAAISEMESKMKPELEADYFKALTKLVRAT